MERDKAKKRMYLKWPWNLVVYVLLVVLLRIFAIPVILLLMFAGRVGSMSVAMAVTRDHPAPRVRNVPEKILIG